MNKWLLMLYAAPAFLAAAGMASLLAEDEPRRATEEAPQEPTAGRSVETDEAFTGPIDVTEEDAALSFDAEDAASIAPAAGGSEEAGEDEDSDAE